MCKKILTIALLCFFSFALKAQEQSEQDSLVTLLSAEYVRLFQIGNDEYREVGGPAVFMHNGAYLHCDSAIWNLDANVIDAFNNVKVIQDKTLLTSDRLTYLVDEDLAQFRGHLVELSSDNENRLRSNNLDYSTRDSVAVFRDGGAMIDKDGNVMEGQVGTYDSRSKVFSFRSDVTMFLDTLFIKTSSLDYKSDEETAYFNDDTYLWRGTGFMRADRGWYQKSDDLVYFQRNVYGNNPDYEGWCDGVYYWRSLSKMEMDGNVTLQDGGHQMALVAQKAEVEMDTLTSTVNAILTKQPAIIYYGKNENDEPDSLFCAADTLNFYTKRVCDIPDSLFKEGKKLRDEILFDAIMAAEEKAAEDAAKKAREAYEKSAEYKAMQQRLTYRAQQMLDSLTRAGAPVPDSIYTRLGMTPPPAETEEQELTQAPELTQDSELTEAPELSQDSTATAPLIQQDTSGVASPLVAEMTEQNAIAGVTDSLSPAPVAPKPLAPEPDTSTRMFIKMYHDVKLYREKMQGRCDSLYFSEVDSVAKLYTSPILWESIRNQLTSDIMMFVLVDGNLDRGSMSQNAMIISQEDENYYNQIKSTEMTGFFKENALSRYDALGGVNALFFLKEQNVVTTLNSKEAQFMMVTMENGTARRLKYYESPKSDAYPVAQLELDKQRVKGFVWRGDERPQSRYELTNGKVRKSERAKYESMHKPTFPITDRYFDGYMTDVYREIERVEQLRRYQKFQRDSTARAEADSTAFEIALEEDIATIESQFQDDDKALQKSLETWGREKNPFKQEVQKESETGLQEGTTVTKSKKEIREERRQKRKQMRQARRQARKEAREARKLTE